MPFAPSPSFIRIRRLPSWRAPVAGWAQAALMVLAVAGWVAPAQAQGPNRPATAASAAATTPKPPAKPLWRDLSAKQQQALQPLAADWDALSEGHKRKWLVLSRNHANLSSVEKATLHSRMTEWAALSQQERAQARFNFAEVKQVPVDERKAKWEAYQALTPEEKRRLAEGATPRPPGAASTIRPVPAQKLAPIPATTTAAAVKGQHSARIQLTPPTAVEALAAPATPPAAPMIPASSISVEAQPAVTVLPAPPAPLVAPPPRSGMTEPPSSAP
jgi:hypothetical protein